MVIKYDRLPSFQISADFKLEMCQDITRGETVMIVVKIKGEEKNIISYLKIKGMNSEDSQIDMIKMGNMQKDGMDVECNFFKKSKTYVLGLQPIEKIISVMYPI